MLPRPLLRKDHGLPILQPIFCCPIYQLADGRYVLIHHNNDGRLNGCEPEDSFTNRRPAYIALGEFRPNAEQPLWFSDSRLLMDNDNVKFGPRQGIDIGGYTSFTTRQGNNVLWHPERKFFLSQTDHAGAMAVCTCPRVRVRAERGPIRARDPGPGARRCRRARGGAYTPCRVALIPSIGSLTMQSRERVVRALRFQHPDRAPRDLWYLPGVQMFRASEIEAVTARFPLDLQSADVTYGRGARCRGTPHVVGSYVDAWGCEWHVGQPGVVGEVKRPPLADWRALDRYRMPDELLRDADFRRVDEGCRRTARFVWPAP